jgi:integrase
MILGETMTIQSFLDERSSPSTQETYWYLLKKYLLILYSDFTGKTPRDLEPLAAQYLSQVKLGERDLVADLRGACKACNAPKSGATMRSAVIEFLRFHDFFPDERTIYKLKKGRKAVHVATVDKPLRVEDALRILSQMDVRARAITYIMLSSGARIGEVLSLRVGNGKVEGDIDLDARPARIIIRETKTGQPRISFISAEAVAAVRDYLKVRDRYVASARARRGEERDDNLLFPVSYRVFQAIWMRAVRKAGLEKQDPKTGRLTMTAHSCRKFFMSKMKAGGIPEAVIEVLVGHQGYLAGAYSRYPEEELAEEYLKGEKFVTLIKAAAEERMSAKMRQQEARIRELEENFRTLNEKFGGILNEVLTGEATVHQTEEEIITEYELRSKDPHMQALADKANSIEELRELIKQEKSPRKRRP